MTPTQLWNANIHYHSLLGIERNVKPGSFDAVVSVATLHHLPADEALARFADLVRPGGVVLTNTGAIRST